MSGNVAHRPDAGAQTAAEEDSRVPRPGPVESAPGKVRYPQLRGLAAAGLAMLLYLLLVDAAVETFLSGSSMRWLVGLGVIAYLALTGWQWRRFGWAERATVSFILLLGLLALTAWWPDAISQGITLLRQPSSTLLAIVTLAAVIYSAAALRHVSFVPPRVRWGIVALAAYAATALLLGIMGGTSYTDLLHGSSFWSRLPFWLQGAFIGAFVLAPTALLVQIVSGVRQVRGIRLRRQSGHLSDPAAGAVRRELDGADRAPPQPV